MMKDMYDVKQLLNFISCEDKLGIELNLFDVYDL